MNFTRTSFLRLIRISSFLLVLAVIVIYAIWRSLNYARGPQIDILEPKNGSTVTSPSVTIHGRVERVSYLAMNGRPLTIDEQGNFDEITLVMPGINRLSFTAHDQFDRNISTELDLYAPMVSTSSQ